MVLGKSLRLRKKMQICGRLRTQIFTFLIRFDIFENLNLNIFKIFDIFENRRKEQTSDYIYHKTSESRYFSIQTAYKLWS